jgi:hypothetical protein
MSLLETIEELALDFTRELLALVTTAPIGELAELAHPPRARPPSARRPLPARQRTRRFPVAPHRSHDPSRTRQARTARRLRRPSPRARLPTRSPGLRGQIPGLRRCPSSATTGPRGGLLVSFARHATRGPRGRPNEPNVTRLTRARPLSRAKRSESSGRERSYALRPTMMPGREADTNHRRVPPHLRIERETWRRRSPATQAPLP